MEHDNGQPTCHCEPADRQVWQSRGEDVDETIFDVHLQNAVDDLWFFAKYSLVIE